MAEVISHFAINADDVPAATAFYGSVFGWTFTPWGPPGFLKIDAAGDGNQWALQEVREFVGAPLEHPQHGLAATPAELETTYRDDGFDVPVVDRRVAFLDRTGGGPSCCGMTMPPAEPDLPLRLAGFAQAAAQRLVGGALDYYAGGAGDELTLRDNDVSHVDPALTWVRSSASPSRRRSRSCSREC